MVKASRGLRLHPTSPLFAVISSVRNLIFVIIAALVASGNDRFDTWIGIVIGIGALFGAARYFTTWYRIDEGELVVSSGIFFRNERHVPLGRIQNLDLIRGPVHRLFGVAEVRVQTASGTEPEAVLRVLSMAAIDRLRAGIGRGDGIDVTEGERADANHADAMGDLVLSLGIDELVRLGLVSNRSLVIVGAAIGLVWEFGFGPYIESTFKDVEPIMRGLGMGATAIAALVGIAIVLVLMPLLSISWTILRFYGFRLERVGEDFRHQCGLLTEYSSSVDRRRVQVVSVRESPLHRMLGRVSIRVETAGGAGEKDQLMSRRWFVPIVARSEADRIVGMVFPGVSIENVEWKPLAKKALRRMMKKAVLSWLAVSAGLAAWFELWGVGVAVVALPLVIWHTVRTVRFMSYARAGEAIMFRSGVWMRATTVTLEDRVQVVTVRESPFDRRHGHASLAIDTAGAGAAERKIAIPYLDGEVAGALRRSIAAQSAA